VFGVAAEQAAATTTETTPNANIIIKVTQATGNKQQEEVKAPEEPAGQTDIG